MCNRCCQIDMAHPLAANTRQRHFNAALLAGNAAILDTLILAAKALIILSRTKDTSTEQTIALWFEGPVIDGFGFFDLS